MTAELAARFESLSFTPTQWRVMASLWNDDGQTQKEISQKTAIDPATLTVMLKRMEERGLVTRRRDPANNRLQRVYLVDARPAEIQRVRETISAHIAAVNAVATEGFDDSERAVLIRLLTRARTNLEPSAEHPQSHNEPKGDIA
ncbi:MarR family winged helix-turn-helix transcriptional regulator [Leifsonia poae]|uniref:MarR family winged helix-turn-helix transcriptional regulator n=1 Tax=Leifsonia poae TaxID=110933 RepID=UPI001CBEE1E8|nr:MarR family winged helix-turn-helix transcriptional regulator [Leifsonia poae]